MSKVGVRVGSACAGMMLVLFATACGGKASEEGTLVRMSPFTFAPSTITVKAGSEITLRLNNTETFQGEPHDWTLMESGFRAEAPWTDEDAQHILVQRLVHPSETETLTFTAPSEPGEYQIVCTIWLDSGMQGILIVTP